MEVFIHHQGQQQGPFPLEEIRSGFASGRFQGSELVWHQGAPGWMPLSTFIDKISGLNVNPYTAMPQTSGMATTSMILGIASMLIFFLSLPAVIFGHIAKKQIKESQGRLTGEGFAMTGLILGYIILSISILAVGAAITAPIILMQSHRAEQAEAISNAKQIGLALYEFEQEYGNYPNAATASLVAAKTKTPEITDSSSNARFRQLFRAGITASEEIFYAKTPNTRAPDGDIEGNKAIASHECGFAYIDNIPPNNTNAKPIAMTPFKPGSNKFDASLFNNKAVILWTDSSVTTLPIDRATGKVLLNGQDILDPTHPVWEGTPPNLVMPE